MISWIGTRWGGTIARHCPLPLHELWYIGINAEENLTIIGLGKLSHIRVNIENDPNSGLS
jgi:hypothetical protein